MVDICGGAPFTKVQRVATYMLHGLELSIYIAASRASRTTGSLWLALSHTVILLPLASYKTISHTK